MIFADDAHRPVTRIQNSPNINSRAVCLFQSLTRRFSNVDPKSPLSSLTARRQNRSFLGASSVVDLSSNNTWNWQSPRTIAEDRRLTDGEVLLASSQHHLPLVMITDTNCSFTNIVELDTFEDKNRGMTEIEKRLRRQLKTFYRPRYST